MASDRVVLVTGASSGIGRAIAGRLAADGDRVVLGGRDPARLAAVVGEIETAGGRAAAAPGDVTCEEQLASIVAVARDTFGRLDALVHNAGSALRDRPVDRTSAADWDAMLDVHVKAAGLLSRAVLPALRRHRGGAIVHVASNLAFVAIPGLTAYVAAKGALVAMTRSMALDHGPEGIRVNCVCPGLVETPMTTSLENYAAKKAGYEVAAPLGRIGRPRDVAGAVAFLLGPDAGWITGQALVVDGGYTIQ